MQVERNSQFNFPKFYRLRKSHEIKSLFSQGKRVESKTFVLYYKKNNLPYPRIAIVTSRKVGKAVFRNKLRRYVREIFRQNKDIFDKRDHVVIIKKNLKSVNYNDLDIEIKKVLNDVR